MEEPVIWKNRIKHLTYEPPDQLLANPKNFRRHPGMQRDVFRGVAEEVGIVAPVIQNDTTGHLLDGHLRVEEALKEGLNLLPVLHVNLTPEEEDTVLATFDAISDLAYIDPSIYAGLLAETVDRVENENLARFLRDECARQDAAATEREDDDRQVPEHDPTTFWPVLKFQVPPETKEQYKRLTDEIDGTDYQKFQALLAMAEGS